MKKILFILTLTLSLVITGCDLIPEEYRDDLLKLTEDYCEENPEEDVCDIDLTTTELDKYYEDYNNAEMTAQDIADMYFEGELPINFEEVRNMRMQYGVTIEVTDVEINADGSFEVTYSEITESQEYCCHKRPGRIRFEDNSIIIVWEDGVDDDCDMVCFEEVTDLDAAQTFYEAFFADFTDSTITDEALERIYSKRKFSENLLEERAQVLENGYEFEDVTVSLRADGSFEVSYRYRDGDDLILRKRPGRLQQRPDLLTATWDELIDDSITN